MPTKQSKKLTRHYRYTLVFKAATDGYIMTVPAIESLSIKGPTIENARAIAGQVIRAHLNNLSRLGLALPSERTQPITEQIEIALDA